MAQVLSERAQRFVQTWERQSYVEDLGLVRAALKKARVPITEPVLDFHRTFAGYITDVWGERGPLGIIHPGVVAIESWFKPMAVGGYLTADEPMLACADIHMSYEMMIALDGTFYCNGPESSSYFLWTEQCAYLWEFGTTRAWKKLPLPGDPRKRSAGLAQQLARYRIDALSDEYGQVYGTERFVVSIGRRGQRLIGVVAEGEWPAELADLKPRARKQKSKAEPNAALDGRRRPSSRGNKSK
jgi:hypothetical protein